MPQHKLPLAACVLAATTLHAQALKDPANLTGERPFPQSPAIARINDPANLTGERVTAMSPADTLPLNHGAPALQQLLLKLRTRASMMLIIAHPDDEDGGLLTYESRGYGVRTAMLTLTRGEGGQNLMSADFNDALGLIRTQELLAADRYFGTTQFFGTEVDFGFSKTREEALAQWTHDRVLYDAVRAVRLYRPLVLASVFVGGPTDGHGQHQVSGQICQEVFTAAADPNVFPEMIAQGLLPWAPLKVYARVPFSRVTPEGMFDYATGKTVPTRFHNYVTGADTTREPAPTVIIPEGDPALVHFQASSGQSALPAQPALAMQGRSYLQFAREGLALQKSQIGAGVRIAPSGAFDVGYTLMASRVGCTHPETLCPVLTTASSSSGRASSEARSSLAAPTAKTAAPTGEIPSAQAPVARSNSGPVSLPPGATAPETSLFEGIDTSLPGLASLAPNASPALKVVIRTNLAGLDKDVAEAQHAFDPAHLDSTATWLREGLATLNSFIDTLATQKAEALPKEQAESLLHELRIKRTQFNGALVLALGLHATASLADAAPLTPGALYKVNYTLANPAAIQLNPAPALTLGGSHAEAGTDPAMTTPVGSTSVTGTLSATIPANAHPTEPPFHQADPTKPFYTVDNPALRNAPQTPAPLVLTFSFNYKGATLELPVAVTAIPTPQPSGQAPNPLQPAVIVPAYSAAITPSVAIASTQPTQRRPIPFSVDIRTNLANQSPRVSIQAPTDWKLDGPAKDFTLNQPGEHITQSLTADPGPLTSKSNPSADPTIKAFTLAPHGSDNTASDLGYRSVGYPGITHTNLYKRAILRVAPVDVTTAPNLRIAYLPGTGDPLPDYLPNLGIIPTLITPADLTPDKLSHFDAILVGVRAYAAQSALAGRGSQPLIDYAKNGGTVILEYMTARFGDPEAPYPISVPGDSAHNVVEEADPVTILAPQNPILTWPNHITSADFQGWTEEWGHGFAATFAPEYQPLLEVHDPEQDPQRGGLLLAPVGKGAYIYCALALYRQLPEGVPGAYRLLANLLSYPKNPTR